MRLVKIGKILGPHGNRGKLKISCQISNALMGKILTDGSACFANGRPCDIRFASVSITGKEDIVIASVIGSAIASTNKGDGANNVNNANNANGNGASSTGSSPSALPTNGPDAMGLNEYAGQELFCQRASLGEQLMVCDLIGLAVYTKDTSGAKKAASSGEPRPEGKEYGTVIGVHNFGAGDIVEISRKRQKGGVVGPKGGQTGQTETAAQTSDDGQDSEDSEMYLLSTSNFPQINTEGGYIFLNKAMAESGIKGFAK